MTSAGHLQERPAPVRALPSGDGTGRTAFDDVADWAARLPWCWPVLLTLALGLYQAGRPELWRDEVASWWFASRPLPRLIAAVHSTGATQLPYYLLLHFWIAAFGDSADAMRALSVLAMAGAAACVTLVGRRMAGARAGLISGLVFALVPSVSRFAQEIRFYALEVLVATLATLLLLRALDKATGWRWAAYGACLAVLGYVDLVALSVIAGQAAAVAVRWWQDRDNRHLWFAPAAFGGLAACLPLALVGSDQAASQVKWIARPGLDLTAFAFFGRNLFYSTSVAAALIVLAVLAWAVARREAAFITAIAIMPVVAVWLVSQGPHSYFFPRYLLLTVAAWAVLAGIGLSRLDVRMAAAAVVVVAILGAGDQQVIRTPGAHSWAYYPVGSGGSYADFAGAAEIIAHEVRPGDAAIYQAKLKWLLIGSGVQYYLERDMPRGVPLPRQLFVAQQLSQDDALYPAACVRPAACLGQEPRIWVVESGDHQAPATNLTLTEAALLRGSYRVSRVRHVPGLTVFLLVRTPSAGSLKAP
jgi:mannosyltransferase